MINSVFVCGATGNQGGAVAASLLRQSIKIKALTRHPENSEAIKLREAGAEIIKDDLNVPASYQQALNEVDAIFSVQTYVNGIGKEIAQGKALIDAAKASKVKHLIYSSVVGCDLSTGIPHWESKNTIERYLQGSKVPFTILRPASFFENLLIPRIKQGIKKGKLISPLNKTTQQHMISVADIGQAATEVFMNPAPYMSQVYNLATEKYDSAGLEAVLSGVTGRRVTHDRLPRLITRIFLGKNLYRMFTWIDSNHQLLADAIEKRRFPYERTLQLRSWAGKAFQD